MRAVQATRFGGPEVLEQRELPEPAARPGHAVVRVAVADVLQVEAQVRSGWGREYFAVQPPYVPGDGIAGEVVAVGDGVDPGWVGRRVAARTGGYGGYAERVAVAAADLVPVPEGLGLPEAAALLHDGPTALSLFEEARVKPAEVVLVVAAAGGMGSLLVQLANAAGARVVGAARGSRKLALARELGAQAVVDYSRADWPERVREAGGGAGADVVFDGVGGAVGEAAYQATARAGHFSAHGAAAGSFAAIDPADAARRNITLRGIEQTHQSPEETKRLIVRALREAAAGRITPFIGQTFPLNRAAEAHRALEARTVVGKTLLEV